MSGSNEAPRWQRVFELVCRMNPRNAAKNKQHDGYSHIYWIGIGVK
jgi:hypothetical protein